MGTDVMLTSWLHELERLTTEYELLDLPKPKEKLDIDELLARARKHSEEHRQEYKKLSQQLRMVLKEIAQVYVPADEESRIQIRNRLKSFKRISYSMESFPYSLKEEITTAQDVDIFRFGLIVASIQDQAIDCRDWSLSVGPLIGKAKSVGIDVNPVLREVADISDPEKHEHAFWTTRDAFLRFVN